MGEPGMTPGSSIGVGVGEQVGFICTSDVSLAGPRDHLVRGQPVRPERVVEEEEQGGNPGGWAIAWP